MGVGIVHGVHEVRVPSTACLVDQHALLERRAERAVQVLQRPLSKRSFAESPMSPAYLSCMIKSIWPDSRILAILDNWSASDGRSLTAGEIEEALEKTTIRYSFAPQVQPGSQYLVTIQAPGRRFDAPKFVRDSDERGDVHPLKQPAMVRMALEYLYLKCLSPQRLNELFEMHFSFSASKL